MKLRVIVDVEVSTTMAENIQRNGFSISPVGSNQRVKVGNSPAIPQRKTAIKYVPNPTTPISQAVDVSTTTEE